MQGFTHVLGKSKLLLPAFKVGRFTDLVAVFESHCSLCTCKEVSEKWPRDFSWSYAINRTDLPFFSIDNPSEMAPTIFHMVLTVESFDSKSLLINIIKILKQRLFLIHLIFLLFDGFVVKNSQWFYLNPFKLI